ncbi:non-receptor protein kinase [Capsaspora owczarzaki ATCC 30864]|uniref:TKL protein kinase, variant 1 n=1 Tax=Capsaspora owczarzaki (strain ATCC 30864) TaxID=595528 RepID=A0A0D2WSQ5_CAPO3|nr:non-receptor protein kinase [Capsaspora owczarzaki ATCC 30864]KJE95295.1 TKL protein kinase, variant 1 [Capsaspora owczarzaki ATCC 30864]KJE95296.1 TKL protein kinase, variant 2 [Capsaspora owczarzaki ATCC 30864]|eukprot:XP_004346434.2 non-receptor protein kinase [Capsaspora owczarzaki ATCC 30864]
MEPRTRINSTTLAAAALVFLLCVAIQALESHAVDACGSAGVCACSGTTVDCSNRDLDLGDIPSGIPANTTSLLLGSTKITTISASNFAGLTALTYLSLDTNLMTSISANTFSNLVALKELTICCSPITSISAQAFNGLSELTSLSIHNNLLTTLSAGTLNSFSFLSFLDLRGNQFSTFPTAAFAGLDWLRTMSIGDNPFTTIPAGSFIGLAGLWTLDLRGSSISSIEANSFTGPTSLRAIYLADCQLTSIPANAFTALTALNYLWLYMNRLTSIPPGAFTGLTALQILHLFTNQITSLPANLLTGLTALNTVSLHTNPFTTLPPGLFQGLQNTLYLTQNLGTVLAPNNFTFGGSTVAPPSMYGSASTPSKCDTACATCFDAGSGSCCGENCLACSSSAVCTQCYEGYGVLNGMCAPLASVASDSVASVASAASSISAAVASDSVASVASAASSVSAARASATSASGASAASTATASLASISSASVASAASTASTVAASVASVASAASATVASLVSISSSLSASVASIASASAASAATEASTSAASFASVASVASAATAASASAASAASNAPLENSDSSSPAAAIAAAVVSVVAVALIALAVFLVRRRRSRQRSVAQPKDQETLELTISPLPKSNSNSNSDSSPPPKNDDNSGYDVVDPVLPEPTYQPFTTTPAKNDDLIDDYDYTVIDDYTAVYVAGSNSSRVRDGLTILKHLASGNFGDVALGQVPFSVLPQRAQALLGRKASSETVQVAVKSLKSDADEKSRKDFESEAKLMAPFVHQNVVRLLAALVESEPHLVLLEFVQYGDLRTLLQKCKLHSFWWTQNEQVHAIRQIALGMEYLGTLHFVHRDLAARNCLVGQGMVVKIADFGLSRELEDENDYYRMQTRGKLPVKWMAPETMTFRKFSALSDVWSFGVTAWECCSYGEQPYGKLSGRDTLAHVEAGGRLPMPENCMPELYNMMMTCWNVIPEFRPSFSQLVKVMSSFEDGTTIRDIGAKV